MAGLSLASNIVSILDLTGTCLKFCAKQVGPSSYSSTQLNDIRATLFGLHGATKNLQTCIGINEEDEARLEGFQHLDEPLRRCNEALNLLSLRLEEQGLSAQYLMGTRFDKKFEDCMRVLGQAKDLLDLALNCDQRTLISATETYIRCVAEETRDIKATLSKQEQALADVNSETKFLAETASKTRLDERQTSLRQHKLEVLAWLSENNSRDNFLDTLETKEPGTGQWLLEDEMFRALTSGKIHSLWLNGIPGAGKTYLLTAAIDHLLRTSKAAVSYYYFDFRESAKQSTLSMLRSLAAQLERALQIDMLSKPTENLYDQCHRADDTRRPTVDEATKLVIDLSRMKPSYIILDALDESADWPLLLSAISSLVEASPKTRLFVACRPELEIKRHLIEAGFASIEANNDGVRHDIELYIDSTLRKDSRFKRLPQELKSEIRDTLVSKADSMFRWVQCQLDTLRPMKSSKEIRNSLKQLPKTLNETYERIFRRLVETESEETLVQIKRLLMMITYGKEPITLEALAQGLIVDVQARVFDRDAAFFDPEEVFRLCPSILTISQQTGYVGFVHYTVQEWLLSNHLAKAVGPISALAFDASTAHRMLAELSLSFVCYDDFSTPCGSLSSVNERIRTYPFWMYAALSWRHHVVDAHVEASVLPLLMALLYPIRNSRLTSMTQAEDRLVRTVAKKGRTTFGYYGSYFDENLSNCLHDLILSKSGLVVASHLGLDMVIRSMIEKGVDLNAIGARNESALSTAIDARRVSTVQLLLCNGADPDAKKGYSIKGPLSGEALMSPLARAVKSSQDNILDWLIHYGADVNKRIDAVSPTQAGADFANRITPKFIVRDGIEVDSVYMTDPLSSWTPLGSAMMWVGSAYSVTSLIAHGASLKGASAAYCATQVLIKASREAGKEHVSKELAAEIQAQFATLGYPMRIVRPTKNGWLFDPDGRRKAWPERIDQMWDGKLALAFEDLDSGDVSDDAGYTPELTINTLGPEVSIPKPALDILGPAVAALELQLEVAELEGDIPWWSNVKEAFNRISRAAR